MKKTRKGTIAERRNQALIEAGIAPSSFAIKKPTRVEPDRKKEQRKGRQKHKQQNE